MFKGIFFAELPPDEWLNRAESSVEHGAVWFAAEKGGLLNSLWVSLAVIAGGAVLIAVGRILAKRMRENGSFRWEVFNAAFTPFVWAVVFGGICFAFSPLRRAVPPKMFVWFLRLFYSAVTLSLVWGICRMISVFNRRLCAYAERQDNRLDKLTVGMFGNVMKTAVLVCAFFFIGQNIFELNITALLAGAGVVGLALALAAKDTVSNFFGTLVIIADSPFRIGDRIECQNITGIVQNVGMRSSRILLDDESICTVPNSILTNSVLRRINPRFVMKRSFDLSLTYSTAPEALERAKTILHEILDDLNGKDAPGNRPHIFFASFGESSLNIRVIVWLKCTSLLEAEQQLDVINSRILHRFNAEKLEFAYPTRTLFLEKNFSENSGRS
ncbi:MAG: mechanosensitive ion channel [Lentisphaerae bacterium]|nr:mechanosensitive ion channel [Lentisphaerota bacterium]